jgi:hypothetical protein
MRTSSIRTRFGLQTAVIAIAALGAVVPVASAAAAPQRSGIESSASTWTMKKAASPVGKWAILVHFEGQTYARTIYFTRTGRVFLGDGGAGTWTTTSGNCFTFRIAEPTYDTAGSLTGWVDIKRTAELNGDTFTDSGVSTVYDLDDVVTRVVQAHDDGTRA